MAKDCTICKEVSRWLKQPFKEDGSVIDWFLFLGLVGAITWLWSRVIARIG